MIEHVMSEALDWVLATPRAESKQTHKYRVVPVRLRQYWSQKGRAINPSETVHVIAQSLAKPASQLCALDFAAWASAKNMLTRRNLFARLFPGHAIPPTPLGNFC